eukprot:6148567-Pleurochrysis_carterae.AAC.1
MDGSWRPRNTAVARRGCMRAYNSGLSSGRNEHTGCDRCSSGGGSGGSDYTIVCTTEAGRTAVDVE